MLYGNKFKKNSRKKRFHERKVSIIVMNTVELKLINYDNGSFCTKGIIPAMLCSMLRVCCVACVARVSNGVACG